MTLLDDCLQNLISVPAFLFVKAYYDVQFQGYLYTGSFAVDNAICEHTLEKQLNYLAKEPPEYLTDEEAKRINNK